MKEYLWRKPAKPVHSTSKYTIPTHGQKVQYSNVDLSTESNDKQNRQIQKITGKFLYNARSVYSILLHALNELKIASSKATEQTEKDLEHFLNYCATNPEAQIIYRASDMQLEIDCDAAYLVA